MRSGFALVLVAYVVVFAFLAVDLMDGFEDPQPSMQQQAMLRYLRPSGLPDCPPDLSAVEVAMAMCTPVAGQAPGWYD